MSSVLAVGTKRSAKQFARGYPRWDLHGIYAGAGHDPGGMDHSASMGDRPTLVIGPPRQPSQSEATA